MTLLVKGNRFGFLHRLVSHLSFAPAASVITQQHNSLTHFDNPLFRPHKTPSLMDLNPICYHTTTVSYFTLFLTLLGNLDNVTPRRNGVNFFNLLASFAFEFHSASPTFL